MFRRLRKNFQILALLLLSSLLGLLVSEYLHDRMDHHREVGHADSGGDPILRSPLEQTVNLD